MPMSVSYLGVSPRAGSRANAGEIGRRVCRPSNACKLGPLDALSHSSSRARRSHNGQSARCCSADDKVSESLNTQPSEFAETLRNDVEIISRRAQQDMELIAKVHDNVVDAINPLHRDQRSVKSSIDQLEKLQKKLETAHNRVCSTRWWSGRAMRLQVY